MLSIPDQFISDEVASYKFMKKNYYYNIYYTIARSLDELELWNTGTMECWVSEMRTYRNAGTMGDNLSKAWNNGMWNAELWNVESAKVSYVRNGVL